MVGSNLGVRRRTDTVRRRHTGVASHHRERGHALDEERGLIIVGIDGSVGSIAALDFALHFVDVTDLTVKAVTVYDPCPDATPAELGPSIPATANLRREDSERRLDQVVTNASAGDHVVRSRRVLAGQPTEVLVDLSGSVSSSTLPVGWRFGGLALAQDWQRRCDQRPPTKNCLGVTFGRRRHRCVPLVIKLVTVSCSVTEVVDQVASPLPGGRLRETVDDVAGLVARLRRLTARRVTPHRHSPTLVGNRAPDYERSLHGALRPQQFAPPPKWVRSWCLTRRRHRHCEAPTPEPLK